MVVLCLWAALCLAGCNKTAGAVEAGNAGGEIEQRAGDGSLGAESAGAGDGTTDGTGAEMLPEGGTVPGGEAEYAALGGDLVRLETKPLTETYKFYDWAGEMKDVLCRYLNLGAALGRIPENGPAGLGGITMTVTSWERGSLNFVGEKAGTAGEGRYRLITAVFARPGGQSYDRAYYLEKENFAVWSCGLLQTANDSLALKWIPEAGGGRGSFFLATAQAAEAGRKTEVSMWRLDGTEHGPVMCNALFTRQIGGQRDGEVLVQAADNGFTVSGTVFYGDIEEEERWNISLGLEPSGDGFSIVRDPKQYEAVIPEPAEYALVLGLAGDMDLRTLWVTARSGEAGNVKAEDVAAGNAQIVCRELPDVALRWTEDGMKTVRYLNYQSRVLELRDSGESYGDTVEAFDWMFLAGQEPLPDVEAVERYAAEHYQWFGSLDSHLTIRERLELVGEDYISATTYNSYWGGGSGTWSNVNAFLSPMEILLQENAHLSIQDLNGMKTSARNAVSRETSHYTQVYEPRVVHNEGWTTVSQIPLTDAVYLSRAEGEVRAVLPVAQLADYPNGSAHMKLLAPLYLDVNVPSAVTGYDKLYRSFDRIRYYIPEAVDAVSAPGGSMLAVETDRELLVFVRPGSLEDLLSPALRIPLSNMDGERIVSASWVSEDEREAAEAAVEAAPDASVYIGNLLIRQ